MDRRAAQIVNRLIEPNALENRIKHQRKDFRSIETELSVKTCEIVSSATSWSRCADDTVLKRQKEQDGVGSRMRQTESALRILPQGLRKSYA